MDNKSWSLILCICAIAIIFILFLIFEYHHKLIKQPVENVYTNINTAQMNIEDFKSLIKQIHNLELKTFYSKGKSSTVPLIISFLSTLIESLKQHSLGSKFMEELLKRLNDTNLNSKEGLRILHKCINDNKDDLVAAAAGGFSELQGRNALETNQHVKMLVDPIIAVLEKCKVNGVFEEEIKYAIQELDDDVKKDTKTKKNPEGARTENTQKISHEFDAIHKIYTDANQMIKGFYELLNRYNIYIIYSSVLLNAKEEEAARELEYRVLSSFFTLALALTQNLKSTLVYLKENRNISAEKIQNLYEFCLDYEKTIQKNLELSKKILNLVNVDNSVAFYKVLAIYCKFNYHIMNQYEKKTEQMSLHDLIIKRTQAEMKDQMEKEQKTRPNAAERQRKEQIIARTIQKMKDSKVANDPNFAIVFDTLAIILQNFLKYIDRAMSETVKQNQQTASELPDLFNRNYTLFQNVSDEYFMLLDVIRLLYDK